MSLNKYLTAQNKNARYQLFACSAEFPFQQHYNDAIANMKVQQ